MRPSVRVVVLLAAITLASCGSGGAGDSSTGAVATPAAPAASAPAPPAAAAATVASTSAPRLPVTVTDRDGRNVTITDVSRIIPLNGDIAEVVWALGLGANVIATDISASYPEEARQSTKIGYQRQLAAEGILSLKPTLVIGNDNAGPPPVIEQLRGAGVTVVILSFPNTLEGAVSKARSVAQALGVPEAGEVLAAKVQREIDAALTLAGRATTKPRAAFLYVRGSTTQQIAGKGTAAHALITAAGGLDAGGASGIDDYKPITPEALVAARPEVLVLLTAGLESIGGIDGLVNLPGVAQTPAGRNRRVLAYDDLYFNGLGPRTGQALMDLVKGLHPELGTP